jgi:hypothetical protein
MGDVADDAEQRREHDDKGDYYEPHKCPHCHGTGFVRRYIGHPGRGAIFPCNHEV